MVADLTETIVEIVPHLGIELLYFTATKATQNDTVTFATKRLVYPLAITVGDGGIETWTSSTNVVTLTSATTGAIRGLVVAWAAQ